MPLFKNFICAVFPSPNRVIIRLEWDADSNGIQYQPSSNQVYFRGLFTPTPQVRVVGDFTDHSYLEADLVVFDEQSNSFKVVCKAVDGKFSVS
jgi:hypothetical protein